MTRHPMEMSNICKTAPNYLDLLRAGTHFSEKRGAHIHIVESKTGVTTMVLSGDPQNMVQLTPTTLADGRIVWLEGGISTIVAQKNITYNPMTLQLLCQKIAEGMGLTRACREPDMPSYRTLCQWRRDHPEVREMLEHAYMDRADTLRDEVMERADQADEDDVEVRRLQVDVRKWAAGVDHAKYSPKAKIDATIAVPTQIIVQTGIERTAPVERDVTEVEDDKGS